MSRLFETVKKYYTMGAYKKKHVANFVMKGKLTPEEYKLITGDDYVNPEK
jgi:uncharacterized XkdX family phage protein